MIDPGPNPNNLVPASVVLTAKATEDLGKLIYDPRKVCSDNRSSLREDVALSTITNISEV